MILIVKRLNNIFIITFVLMSFMSCSDDDAVSEEDSIIGSWDWYETSGGIAGIIDTPETTGETRKVVFQENGNVTFYTNEVAILSTTYTLAEEVTIISPDPLPVVKVYGDFDYIYSFPYVDELELQENEYDGFIHNYRKE
jgi:hypothetical protein